MATDVRGLDARIEESGETKMKTSDRFSQTQFRQAVAFPCISTIGLSFSKGTAREKTDFAARTATSLYT
jgi:hypothetical protein